MPTPIRVEFFGGSEFLFGNQKNHSIELPVDAPTITDVIHYLHDNLLVDKVRADHFFLNDGLQHGILVLVNDCDWELLDMEQTKLKSGDLVAFVSTLHGG